MEFQGPVALKIRRKDVPNGISENPKIEFSKILWVTYPLKVPPYVSVRMGERRR